MSILYAILSLIISGLFIYLGMLFTDWNHKRRLHVKFDWICYLYDSLEDKSFIYNDKEFNVRVERGELTNPYKHNGDSHVAFSSDWYEVYINNVLVIVMNIIETCGPSYRFIKYPSEYDSIEIEKIIKKAKKLYWNKKYNEDKNNITIKSFLR